MRELMYREMDRLEIIIAGHRFDPRDGHARDLETWKMFETLINTLENQELERAEAARNGGRRGRNR